MSEFPVKKRNFEMLMLILLSVTFLVPILDHILSSSGIMDLFRSSAPKGQLLYILSKIFAICAFALLFWQLLLGMLKITSRQTHIILGSLLFLLIVLHVISFVSAVSIRNQSFALDILLPNFNSGYYKSGLSLGVIALVTLIAAVSSATFRSKISKKWIRGHHLVFVMYVLVVAHSLMIGSEMLSDGFLYMLYLSGSIILFISVIKIFHTSKASKEDRSILES